MKHTYYVTRADKRPTAHLYPESVRGTGYMTTSLCGQARSNHGSSKPGDGRPTCLKCAKMARSRGWL